MEAQYCLANGHSHNAEVIYGDTDSVMVKFGPTDLVTVMALGMYFGQVEVQILSGMFMPYRQGSRRFCHHEVHQSHKA